MQVDPIVDETTADETAHKREDGTRVTVGQVAEAQARLLDLIHRQAVQWQKSGNPARRAAGAELRELMRR
jgi:hypothetical protein